MQKRFKNQKRRCRNGFKKSYFKCIIKANVCVQKKEVNLKDEIFKSDKFKKNYVTKLK